MLCIETLREIISQAEACAIIVMSQAYSGARIVNRLAFNPGRHLPA